jgi:hypothetical protein
MSEEDCRNEQLLQKMNRKRQYCGMVIVIGWHSGFPLN